MGMDISLIMSLGAAIVMVSQCDRPKSCDTGALLKTASQKAKKDSLSIEDRRTKVKEMLRCGFTQPEIASILDVHRNTIWADAKAIHESLQFPAVELDPDKELRDALDLCDSVERISLKQAYKIGNFDSAVDHRSMTRHLANALSARKIRLATLFRVGLAEGLSRKQPLAEIEIGKLSDEEMRTYSLRLSDEIKHVEAQIRAIETSANPFENL